MNFPHTISTTLRRLTGLIVGVMATVLSAYAQADNSEFSLHPQRQILRAGDSLELEVALAGGESAPITFSQRADPYADSPEWYKPGHPLNAAEPAAISVLPGFKIEKLLTVPHEAGSITAMTKDDEGRLIVAMQHQPGLYRIRPTKFGSDEPPRLEVLGGQAGSVGWSQGLLYAFDSLYVTISEKNGVRTPGLYRLLDTNTDGEFDEVIQLLSLDGSGEHGPHNVVVGPKGNSLYFICGNGTPLPDTITSRRTVSTTGYDHLMPEGFESTAYTEAGWVIRMDPDGSRQELFAAGLRNSYDLAFNERGDLFTFDSDMEYDLGTPWYRPTRICHVVSGSEFGWRSGAGKWPEHYEDSVKPVLNIGPASPTGVIFGYETSFPGKYRTAFFVLDWTYATLYAVHLKPNGATYTADFEVFASGVGLPLTDVVIGNDGAMYLSVGGRRLGSAVYRIYYDGPGDAYFDTSASEALSEDSRDLSQSLEYFHGKSNRSSVAKIWIYLGSEDPSIRFAARIALESQPIETWKDRALSEQRLQIKFPALLALARQGTSGDLLRVLDALKSIDVDGLSDDGLLIVLRIYEQLLARGGFDMKELADDHTVPLSRLLPHSSKLVNRELSRILCYLGEASIIDPLLDLMASDTGEQEILGTGLVERNLRYGSRVMDMMQASPMVERMHHAAMLTWIHDGWKPDQRKRYFELVVDARLSSKGGKGYQIYWEQILDLARNALTEEENDLLAPLWAPLTSIQEIPVAQGPGRIWGMDYLLDRISDGFGKRDFENGRKMYAAANCASCHAMGSEGGIVGPNLTSVWQRFTVRDVLDSIINPSKAISDQYQLASLVLTSGETLSGSIHSRDSRNTVILPNALKPTQTRTIRTAEISTITPLTVSSMPPDLLITLNEEEVLDLIAYIMAGGHPEHALYQEN